MEMQGRMAGAFKCGAINNDIINIHLGGTPTADPAMFGFNPMGPSGENPSSFVKKIEAGIRFFSDTAKVVYPKYCQQQDWKDRFTKTILTWSAYSGEIEFFKNMRPEYVSLGHNNLNIDNAYFWKDPQNKLDCGVIDFGGFGVSNLGHKLYWILNCSEFENIRDNLDDYIAMFVTTYQRFGGPQLDPNRVRLHVFQTMVANCNQMMQAIPNCMKMCPAKEWDTIKDRHDPRIAGNIDGKSTLRSTLRQTDNGIRMIEECGGDKVLQDWIETYFVGGFECQAKSESMIWGKPM